MVDDARSDTSVQHFGCWALANVGWGQADVQRFAREEGAIEAIQARLWVGAIFPAAVVSSPSHSMDNPTRSAPSVHKKTKWRVTK